MAASKITRSGSRAFTGVDLLSIKTQSEFDGKASYAPEGRTGAAVDPALASDPSAAP
jgi:hypothetical protein